VKRRHVAYLFALPAIVIILIMTIFPLIYSLRISFTRYYLPSGIPPRFIGLKNYIQVFRDSKVSDSIIVTLKILVPALALEFLLGLAIALLLNRITKGKSILTSIITAPMLISPAAAGMAFRLLYHPTYGPINDFLSLFFHKSFKIDWLGSPRLAIYSIMIVDVWQMTPFIALVLLAGLTSIPEELYESGKIDGGSALQLFRGITLPFLRMPIIVAVLFRLMDLLKFFDLVYVLTFGGPARTTETITFYTYFTGIRFFKVGYGAALSFILLYLIIILSSIFLKVTRKKEVL